MTRPLASVLQVWVPHLLIAGMGAAVAIASVAVHRIEAHILGVVAPAGLFLGVAASFAAVWALRSIVVPARTAMTYAVGWLAAFSLLLLGRPEGDYLIAGDAGGYALMVAGLVVVLLGVLGPTHRRFHV